MIINYILICLCAVFCVFECAILVRARCFIVGCLIAILSVMVLKSTFHPQFLKLLFGAIESPMVSFI